MDTARIAEIYANTTGFDMFEGHGSDIALEDFARAIIAATNTDSQEAMDYLQRDHSRYEYVRKLNVHQFGEIFQRGLAGERFDDIIDVACGNLSAMPDRRRTVNSPEF